MFIDDGKETAESSEQIRQQNLLWKLGMKEICHSTKRTQFYFVILSMKPFYLEQFITLEGEF
jgi:hypothetical protein